MFIRNKLAWMLFPMLLGAQQQGQNQLTPRSTLHITLPEDSPLAVLSANWGESIATPRGSAILLHLRTSLVLRNEGDKRIRGVTLLVLAQEVAPGGKASVSVPSLDVGPNEAFPIRLDLSLLRPQTNGDEPLVEVSLDGVLFEDLSFYGPNRLNSRRSMTTWELEARRDRRYLKHLYETAGEEQLRKYLTDVQARLSEKPKRDVEMARGRTTAMDSDESIRFAFLQMPNQPVLPREGGAKVNASEASAPELLVENIGNRPVKYFEIGWILSDDQGEEFFAGFLPAEVNLMPGQRTRVQQNTRLKMKPRSGKAAPITGMVGFVNQVEFADGSIWIPQRSALEQPRLRRALNPSSEEQRLSDLYRRKGINAVVDELLRRH